MTEPVVAQSWWTAEELAAAIRTRHLSSAEALEHHLARIERLNAPLNAIVTLDEERALTEARRADEATARGESFGPLHGVPVTIKDCIETQGLRTTVGTKDFADYVPPHDATAVARLRAAGAIVFGKTNLPAFAADCQSYNDVFGTTNNPWDLTRTPGGSSGGAAAAVAAGLTAADLGSDLGGSIRLPAHFCGVYGHKPSYGLIPLRGHIPPPPGVRHEIDVAVLGPLARHPDDLDLLLGVLAGPDETRRTAWQLQLPAPRRRDVKGLRIVAWFDDPAGAVDRDTRRLLHATADALGAAGAIVDHDLRPPALAGALGTAQRLIQGSISHALPEDDYDRLVDAARRFGPDDQSPPARWARNITQSARALNSVIEARAHLAAAWAELFKVADIVLCPVTPTPAFPHDHNPDVDARTIMVDDEVRSYGDQFAWLQSVGVVHLPVTTAPIGLSSSGLPIGMQIVGALYEDRTTIHCARLLAELIGGYRPPPGY